MVPLDIVYIYVDYVTFITTVYCSNYYYRAFYFFIASSI